MKQQVETIQLEKIVGGGQALGTGHDGRKAFVWGALPGETATVMVTKKKSKLIEGIATDITDPSPERTTPKDPESYLSTSPWQIMDFSAEQHYKAALIEEAFELHDIVLPHSIEVFSDTIEYGYRNKVEFSWWGDIDENGNETLDLAFFRRGSKGKLAVNGTSLAREEINILARQIRDTLHATGITARQLKTLLIRCDRSGSCTWQLYVKDRLALDEATTAHFNAQGGEVIYSDPKSPASRITERLQSFGTIVLHDSILTVPFRYATEGFFQVNPAVYEESLTDMKSWLGGRPVVDMYSGVGTIGLTIGGDDVVLVESDEHAVREMKRNITELGIRATAIHAPSEHALDYIEAGKTIIVDPPRAGLHSAVIERLLATTPERIVYLSCNPVTQARDVALLAEKYGIRAHRGYNYFPRTPHIEHLVVLDLKTS